MRSRRLVMSLRSLDDLYGIYSYSAEFNPVAARRLLDQLNQKIDWMAKAGATGIPRAFIPGLRAFPFRNRCIYFLTTKDTLTVLRVLHGHQDVSSDDFMNSEN